MLNAALGLRFRFGDFGDDARAAPQFHIAAIGAPLGLGPRLVVAVALELGGVADAAIVVEEIESITGHHRPRKRAAANPAIGRPRDNLC